MKKLQVAGYKLQERIKKLKIGVLFVIASRK
jgi:hypothetical protein